MKSYWERKLDIFKDRLAGVKAIKKAFLIGNSQDSEYNRGVLNGMELAIAVIEDREPNLKIHIKKN